MMESHLWASWLYSKGIDTPLVHQDERGVYWYENKHKKRLDWLAKHHEFHRTGMGKRQHNLLKAIFGRLKVAPFVMDACAGLGQDAFLMSLGGCRVIACESNPQIYAVLHDACLRAKEKGWCGMDNMSLVFMNSILLMQHWPESRLRPDVVYLDPMFDKPYKGEVKAYARLLKLLACQDSVQELLEVALKFARNKVVVKRPLKGGCLMGKAPTYQLTGKTTRYDIYQC